MKTKALEKERIRAANEINETDFISSNYFVKWAAMWILYPIVALWSAFTAGGHLFTHFDKTFNSFEIAVCLTIIVVILLEVGKVLFGESYHSALPTAPHLS